MGKIKTVFMICLIAGAGVLGMSSSIVSRAVSEDGKDTPETVAIDETNFPDERFRSVAMALDRNQDSVLSISERQALKKLIVVYKDSILAAYFTPYVAIRPVHKIGDFSTIELDWSWRGEQKKLSLKGIEYFSELTSYSVIGYNQTTGSLKKNAKLKEICLALAEGGVHAEEPAGTLYEPVTFAGCGRVEKDFPMRQLKTIQFGVGFRFKKFSLKQAVKLQTLEFGNNDVYRAYHQEDDYVYEKPEAQTVIGSIDVRANRKLKKITLRNVKVNSIKRNKRTKLKKR